MSRSHTSNPSQSTRRHLLTTLPAVVIAEAATAVIDNPARAEPSNADIAVSHHIAEITRLSAWTDDERWGAADARGFRGDGWYLFTPNARIKSPAVIFLSEVDEFYRWASWEGPDGHGWREPADAPWRIIVRRVL